MTDERDRSSPGRRKPVPLHFGGDPVLWAAWLYYEEGLKQEEVAARLGMSRASVFNLLQKARDDGVVTITVDVARMRLVGLAAELAGRNGLAECYVVPAAGGPAPLADRIGTLGARVLESHLSDGDVLGVAWGRTVLALSRALAPRRLPGASVAQITGSSIATYDFSPELCTSNIAVRLGARCINLHAPGIVSSPDMKALLLREPVIAQHFSLLRGCTRTLFGVTHMENESSLTRSGFFSEAILAEYRRAGAVGFVAGHVFDSGGAPVTTEIDARHLVMPRGDFLNVPQRICIGGGGAKVAAIRAMLAGGYASILVTDETTARALLDG